MKGARVSADLEVYLSAFLTGASRSLNSTMRDGPAARTAVEAHFPHRYDRRRALLYLHATNGGGERAANEQRAGSNGAVILRIRHIAQLVTGPCAVWDTQWLSSSTTIGRDWKVSNAL
jgi:hypothetical protein